MRDLNNSTKQALESERSEVLQQLDEWLETPMVVLGFVWLALLVVELTRGLSPFLEVVGAVIWIVFIIDFTVKFTLAPHKLPYLKSNWLTAVALLVPAFRVLRVVRAIRLLRVARAARGLRLLRVITSLNRGMKALRASMGRRGLGYVMALTTVVILSGAAGMYAFEHKIPGGLSSYGAALWWTAMLMTSIGSDYWPQTAEGRALCFILALYGFAVFGYVTASLATFFIERDAEDQKAGIAGAQTIRELSAEIVTLRQTIEASLENDKKGSRGSEMD